MVRSLPNQVDVNQVDVVNPTQQNLGTKLGANVQAISWHKPFSGSELAAVFEGINDNLL